MAHLLNLGLDDSVGAARELDEVRDIVPEEGKRFGKFDLIELVGEGGMGVIYRALERSTERLVALKMIRTPLVGLAEVRQRFKREVTVAARLEHENILPIYEVNEWGGIPYFSMKFAEGGSLMDHLHEYSRQPPGNVAALLIKIAKGIQHAHERNVIHRDLKPGNILLDAAGEPLVADFGLAELLLDTSSPDLTRSLTILGTPGYIAPELAKGESAVTADVYGLGAIFYHLLTGKRPFEGLPPFESLTSAAASSPTDARQLRREIPKAFASICDCCLQPKPSDRYPSAEALGADLERALQGRPQLRPRARSGRRRARFVGGAAILAAVGLAFFLIFGGSELIPHMPKARSSGTKARAEAKYFLDRARETLAREHSEPNLRNAEQLIRQALTVDKDSALIHAELSRVLSKVYWHIAPSETTAAEAKSEAEFALQLDPKLATAHLAMADYLFRCRRKYQEALRPLETAGMLDPSDGTVPALAALVLKRLNRWDEALASGRRACELEPGSAPRHYDLAATCDVLRRYSEALLAIERARYLAPDNPAHTQLRAWLLFRDRGDISGLKAFVETLPFQQRMDPQYFDTVFFSLLWSGRYPEAVRLAEALSDDYAVRRYDAFLLKPYFVGLARWATDDLIGAREAFAVARDVLGQDAQQFPNDARVHGQLGIVYGYLGMRDLAVNEGKRAVQLLSMEEDPVGGPYVATQLAQIYAIVGEVDRAVSLIRDLLNRPGHLTVHELKADPVWRTLRESTDFRRLLEKPSAGN